jgi:hypothetical protein
MQTWQVFFRIDNFGKALEIEDANQWKATVEKKMESLKRNNM